jgi:hypothetical protein
VAGAGGALTIGFTPPAGAAWAELAAVVRGLEAATRHASGQPVVVVTDSSVVVARLTSGGDKARVRTRVAHAGMIAALSSLAHHQPVVAVALVPRGEVAASHRAALIGYHEACSGRREPEFAAPWWT